MKQVAWTPANKALVEALNRSGRQPVLFVHGLWLEPSSWQRWIKLFEQAGYACAAPAWPGDKQDIEAARLDKNGTSETLTAALDVTDRVASALDRPPVLVGHSFGGLLAQIVAGRGSAAVTVAIAPAAFRGVLPLPLSAIRSASPVLLNPANRNRRIALTFEQFRYAFANALNEAEAKQLFDRFAVPAPGDPLFEAAFANLNPWTADRLDAGNKNRGPLLLISGDADHTVPPAVVEAEYRLQKTNSAVTQYKCLPGRGHSMVIDDGWREVAEIALEFASRSAPPRIRESLIDEAGEESFPASDPPAL